MKFDKIVYLRYIPLTEKIYNDFYMEPIITIGVAVEYWDFSALFFASNCHLQEDSSHLVNTVKFHSYEDLEREIVSQDRLRTLFISIVTYEPRVVKLFKLLTKYDCILGVFGRNMFPTPQSKLSVSSLWNRFNRVTPRKVLNFIRRNNVSRFKRCGTIKGYDIMFLGGAKGWYGIGQIEYWEVEKAQKIMVNSDDYDDYLHMRDAPRLIDEQYILFLDEYLPFHPDAALFGMKNIKADDYYRQLNSYFDRVEQQFKMPVVIAAHPKALKYQTETFFDGRDVYFGKSALLSRDAYYVIAHNSTSINYPVAFGTRLHFITSKAIENGLNITHRHTLSIAQYLGCNWQYFDDIDESINVIETLPAENYVRYKYDFQCSLQTENKQTRDIFIEYIKE